jgi:hypothetical protein
MKRIKEFLRSPLEKHVLERPKKRWEDNIKTDLTEIDLKIRDG